MTREHADAADHAPAPSGRLVHAIRAADWQPMTIDGRRLPGFWIIPIVDDESGQWSGYWMRLDPGARSRLHTHTSTELLFILDGVYTDQDGTDIVAGQAVTYPAGTSHWSHSRAGCTALVVTNTESSL